MIRFGRFDEVLEVTSRPRAEITGGLWDFAQGYAWSSCSCSTVDDSTKSINTCVGDDRAQPVGQITRRPDDRPLTRITQTGNGAQSRID